ncbi:hypothetical protein VTH06DRAFT_56 [Thermothelomyces fergusii]
MATGCGPGKREKRTQQAAEIPRPTGFEPTFSRTHDKRAKWQGEQGGGPVETRITSATRPLASGPSLGVSEYKRLESPMSLEWELASDKTMQMQEQRFRPEIRVQSKWPAGTPKRADELTNSMAQ